MKLMTEELIRKFPGLRQTGNTPPDKIRIIAKYFYPCSAATWYAVEYDPEERLFFGYVNLGDPQCAELGYFSLDELEQFKGRFGLGIERDLYFGEHYLSEVLSRKFI